MAPKPPAATERNGWMLELDTLKGMPEEHIRSGAVRSERAVAMRQVLEKMQAVRGAAARGEIGPEQAGHRVRQLFADAAPFFADPGRKGRGGDRSPRLTQ